MTNAKVKVRVRVEDISKLQAGEGIYVVSLDQRSTEPSLPQTTVEVEIPLDEMFACGKMIRLTTAGVRFKEQDSAPPRLHLVTRSN